MKTIGIIGGMSPESTVVYYQTINREIKFDDYRWECADPLMGG